MQQFLQIKIKQLQHVKLHLLGHVKQPLVTEQLMHVLVIQVRKIQAITRIPQLTTEVKQFTHIIHVVEQQHRLHTHLHMLEQQQNIVNVHVDIPQQHTQW